MTGFCSKHACNLFLKIGTWLSEESNVKYIPSDMQNDCVYVAASVIENITQNINSMANKEQKILQKHLRRIKGIKTPKKK